MNKQTFEIRISGQVQGVGFRPFVYNLANKNKLCGTVCNNENGVQIRLNTTLEKTSKFLTSIIENAPEISNIQSHVISEIPFYTYADFSIIPSEKKGQINIPLTPDFATCESCKAEIRDQSNRRHGYAFTTCTNCGPRYAVTTKFPFERSHTTVSVFEMCNNCQTEYKNPNNRRFHSQTNSCLNCGINIKLVDSSGRQLNDSQHNSIKKAANLLSHGSILAIKNTNGYILCCEANNKASIVRLRRQKKRQTKPFALLYPSIEKIKQDFEISAIEEQALISQVAPIVIVNPKNENLHVAQASIAPGLNQLGVMLPSSALLTLLMDEFNSPIIATSGNIHGSPILSEKEAAEEKLFSVADYFIHHDLEISFPQDDSVFRFVGNHKLTIRRSRGLAPNYLGTMANGKEQLLAMGAHLKSTFSFVPNTHIYVSPYFGNLDNYNVLERFQESISKHLSLFETKPEIVLIDAHPQYQSSLLGMELANEWKAKLFTIQHHKAHFASVLGEHDLFETEDKILGVVWDGTGFGDDGIIWGGEFFSYENSRMQRLAHFEYYEWLASDKMAKEPRLSLLSILPDDKKEIIKRKFSETEWKIYSKMLANNPLKTSSVGRLFDAVASLLDIIDVTTYEGEAAMLLENQARRYVENDFIDFLEDVDFENIPVKTIIKNIHKAILKGFSIPQIANSFIHTLALVIIKVAKQHEFSCIACSGGVFQNSVLIEKLIKLSDKSKINLKLNRILSSNDENISFGQLCYYQHIKK